MLSLPFLFFSTGLPLLMLRHNCHPKAVQKIILWTPVVPLVMVQVAPQMLTEMQLEMQLEMHMGTAAMDTAHCTCTLHVHSYTILYYTILYYTIRWW